VLFRVKALMDKHLEELTLLCAKEHGKVWDEAMGDVAKAIEVVEFASRRDAPPEGSERHERDARLRHRPVLEPLGVFAAIAPWNFRP